MPNIPPIRVPITKKIPMRVIHTDAPTKDKGITTRNAKILAIIASMPATNNNVFPFVFLIDTS
jgi:hypothetical protein